MEDEMRSHRYMPYPELVEDEPGETPYLVHDSRGKPWLPSPGMVNKSKREIWVPFNDGGAATARHEIAHVKWSPRVMPKVSYDPRVLMAVEDARINKGMEAKGVPVRMSAGDKGRVTHFAAQDLENGDAATLIVRAIAAIGTDAVDAVLAALADGPPHLRALAEELVELVETRLERSRRRNKGQPVATFRAARRAAGEVARRLRAHGLLRRRGAARPVVMPGSGCCLSDRPLDVATMRRLFAEAGSPGLRALRGEGDARAAAGRMRVVEARLNVACRQARGAAPGYRAATEGSIIRYPTRWFYDKRIFRQRMRVRGGSVLVDTSSSMRLRASDVDRILRDAPAATLVAIYSGSGEEGELRVVARDGRRASADALKPFGHSNVVDLPAIRWLAKQPAPRVWISDGKVTGVNDRPSDSISRACRELCRRFDIRRVTTAEEAARVLEGRAKPKRKAVAS